MEKICFFFWTKKKKRVGLKAKERVAKENKICFVFGQIFFTSAAGSNAMRRERKVLKKIKDAEMWKQKK